MNLLRKILFAFFLGAAFFLSAAPVYLVTGNKLRIRGVGLASQLKLVFASDIHLTEADERDAQYQENYKRMAQCVGNPAGLLKVLETAQKADMLILGGDILSFPSLANVDFVANAMKGLQKPWYFLNGNHDWHFENLPETEGDRRAEWSANRLAPLFQGRNPLMCSCVVKGVKIIMLDNGTGEILPEQLDFFRQEIADGKPALLALHIPLFVSGRGLDYACGHPDWTPADPAEKPAYNPQWGGHTHAQSTQDFCQTVWTAPNLIAILAGHTHVPATDYQKGKLQIVAPLGSRGDCLEVTVQ